MPRVLENGIRKTTSEVMESTYDKYMRSANPIRYFVDNMLVNDDSAKISKLDMYDAYEKFCLDNGLALESDQSFSRKMTKSLGYDCRRLRVKGSDRVYFWIGVRPKTPEEIEKQRKLQDLGEYYSPETQEEMK